MVFLSSNSPNRSGRGVNEALETLAATELSSSIGQECGTAEMGLEASQNCRFTLPLLRSLSQNQMSPKPLGKRRRDNYRAAGKWRCLIRRATKPPWLVHGNWEKPSRKPRSGHELRDPRASVSLNNYRSSLQQVAASVFSNGDVRLMQPAWDHASLVRSGCVSHCYQTRLLRFQMQLIV